MKWSYFGPKLKKETCSRNKKTNNRRLIKWCLTKCGWKNIHSIWDDYYYWIARYSWEDLYKMNYEEYYKDHYVDSKK